MLRRVARIFDVLLVVLLVLAVGIRVASYQRLHRTYVVQVPAVLLPTDTTALRRGEHLVSAIAKCGDCHGNDLGGKIVIDDPKLGRFVAPNLTRGRGGVGASLSDGDLVAAIRHGVTPARHALLLMPSDDYAILSNADLLAIVAYVRRQPPVDRAMPPFHVGVLGHVLIGLRQFPIAAEGIDHFLVAADSVVPSVSVAYGKYLAIAGGCTGCHNVALSGQHVPGTPPTFKSAANITRGGLPDWTIGDFRRVLREGKTPLGTVVDSFMPYRRTRLMTDDEIDALWMYVRSLPARAYGKR